MVLKCVKPLIVATNKKESHITINKVEHHKNQLLP